MLQKLKNHTMSIFKRVKNFKNIEGETCFLWGPRQTGKSTLLKNIFSEAAYYDLLLSENFSKFSRHPEFFRQEVLELPEKQKALPIIIDEVQKIPLLLNEVQWLIVNKKLHFILCGSSARKLKKGAANLLGGRAIRQELYPLVSREINDFDLMKVLNRGLLPEHYLAKNPNLKLKSYVGDYLREEVMAEALTRNVSAFSRFLEIAAFSNGEIVNYQNIATECGVSAPTVREYFQILSDTLVGHFVESFRQKPKRRIIQSPKFYYFDLGLANVLLNRKEITFPSEIFGRVFEHFIFQELRAHSHYSGLDYRISYWRTSSGLEVDFVLASGDVAVEVKGTKEVLPKHLKGLRAFAEDYRPRKKIIVSLDASPRLVDDIQILPWSNFLEQLWSGIILNT